MATWYSSGTCSKSQPYLQAANQNEWRPIISSPIAQLMLLFCRSHLLNTA